MAPAKKAMIGEVMAPGRTSRGRRKGHAAGHEGDYRPGTIAPHLQQERGAPAAQPVTADQPVQDGAGRQSTGAGAPLADKRLARIRRGA